MKLLRTMMFVPGNNPGMIIDAGIYPCDCLMFDLEDSVAQTSKIDARFLVQQALLTIDYPQQLVVRINDPYTMQGKEDLEAIVSCRKAVIRLPKTETSDDVRYCAKLIEMIEKKHDMPIGETKMMAAIEGPTGVLNACEIAKSSKRLIGIALGAEDYVTSMKTTRGTGEELFFARSMILHAARAANIAAIDTVYSDVNNEEGFIAEVNFIHQLGFDGKSIINPKQIKPVHEAYAPSEKEIEKALAIEKAIEEANQRGLGVISLNGKMIDKPVVERAKRTIALAKASGILKENS